MAAVQQARASADRAADQTDERVERERIRAGGVERLVGVALRGIHREPGKIIDEARLQAVLAVREVAP